MDLHINQHFDGNAHLKCVQYLMTMLNYFIIHIKYN